MTLHTETVVSPSVRPLKITVLSPGPFVPLSVVRPGSAATLGTALAGEGNNLTAPKLPARRPDLRQRSGKRVAGWVRFLLRGGPRPAPTPRGRFLLAYGLASRLFSLVFLVLLLAEFYRLLRGTVGRAGAGPVALLGAATVPGMFQGFAGTEVRKMIRTRRKGAVAWPLAAGGLAAALVFVRVEDRAGGPFEAVPVTRAEVRAPVAGFLREVPSDEGEHVSRGAPVARLEIPDLDSQLAQKRAAVREAAARLRMLEAGARPEEVAEQRGRVKRAEAWRDLAERDLDRARRALGEEAAELARQVERQLAEQQFAERSLARTRKLLGLKAASEEQYDEAQKQLKVAGAQRQQVEARQQALRERGALEAEKELAKRNQELADAGAVLRLLEVGARPEEVEAERARLARLGEEVLYLEGLQGKLVVCTPVPGLIVTPRLKEKAGRYLREGDLICEVEDPARLELEVALPESDAARIAPGQAVAVMPRALPLRSFPGRVDRRAPRAVRAEPGAATTHSPPGELPSTVIVHCVLEATETGLRPGMTGHARISCGERPLAEVLAGRALRYLRTELWW